MPYVSPKDLSVSSSITSTPNRSANSSPPPPEPVASLAAALAKTHIDAPPALSECATSSSNSVQTLQSSPPVDVEVVSPSQPPAFSPGPDELLTKRPESAEPVVLPQSEERTEVEEGGAKESKEAAKRREAEEEAERQHAVVEEIRAGLEGEETVVQDAPSGTALDAVPADVDEMELGKLAQYSRAIFEYTLRLYQRAERESLAKGHTLPGEYERVRPSEARSERTVRTVRAKSDAEGSEQCTDSSEHQP